ncbi:PREDICTED: uncharacterized protein LOC105361733 [Ceratosolen solmsi marchali]|uniref:Uncharacterized protein LOC105361733 n=1 Tax=Ceratosolen solmsi marchali TaxID=326594 RepID=A0AAJ6YFU8_9HYME|nr:PREDICTED: uncharacterized protein LOC105361733 [Ceratosolen solmsi marchali]
MPSAVCRGCRRPLFNENNGRNIFDDSSLIKSFDCYDSYYNKWYMKLSCGIELITGQKEIKEEKLPQRLCQVCFQNVESYINFRFELLRSKDIFLSSYEDIEVINDTKPVDVKNVLLNNLIPKVNMNDTIKKLPEVHLYQTEFNNSSMLSNLKIINFMSDAELKNDYENNNLNHSNTSTKITNIPEINFQQSDYDIESEIDVCSGEDDDVFVLDIQKLKNETVDISSSSESDIEVCDYKHNDK